MKADPGYFGPESMMWKVNKEITVLVEQEHNAYSASRVALVLDKHLLSETHGKDLQNSLFKIQ